MAGLAVAAFTTAAMVDPELAANAAALGRPVMAVPGPVISGQSAGCHVLVRENGALLVTMWPSGR